MIRPLATTATCLLACCAVSAPAAAQERAGPGGWLEDMSRVVEKLDYQGTVIRQKNGKAETIRVVHKVIDGVVNEKLVYQEGNGLEIIRFGNEVHCVLPDKKSVLIEKWSDQSTLFSSLPDGNTRLGAQYQAALVREERTAGRQAVIVAIRPHDEFRYGHRLWLDKQTAFPLRTDLLDNDGQVLEQVKFAQITLGDKIPAKSLRSSFDLQNFTWYAEPERSAAEVIESDWASDDLPPGFRLVSTTNTSFPGTDTPVTHIVYSDGLATVSVFIGEKSDRTIAERSSEGASSSYSTERDGFQITAIGEVPEATVQRIARSMRLYRE